MAGIAVIQVGTLILAAFNATKAIIDEGMDGG